MSKPLTVSEILDLRDGDRIIVTWSGGNGPHEYKAKRYGGTVWAEVISGPYAGEVVDPLVHLPSDARCLHNVVRA